MAKAKDQKKASKKEDTKKANTAQKESKPRGNGGNWYTQGEKGFEKKKELDTLAKLQAEKNVWRFRLKEAESAKIVIVDDSPFFIHEHQLQIGGKWGNFATCVKDFDTCRVCLGKGDRPTYTGYLTILDNREYTSPKDGKVYKNQKRLWPLKGSAIQKFEDLKKDLGSLKGTVLEVKRYKDEPNCGGTFKKLGKIDILGKFGKESATPFDYLKVLAPPTEEELAALGIYTGATPGSEKDEGSIQTASASDDDLDDLL